MTKNKGSIIVRISPAADASIRIIKEMIEGDFSFKQSCDIVGTELLMRGMTNPIQEVQDLVYGVVIFEKQDAEKCCSNFICPRDAES